MVEGWLADQYVVLFEQSEWSQITERYGLAEFLGGYSIEGLLGWDDFILRDLQGKRFHVPTVPLIPDHVQALDRTIEIRDLVADVKVAERIKWYVKPIVFGGSPELGDNVTWVSLQQHVELVRWWNRLYRDLKEGKGSQ
jgi:hypothetical protein